MLLEELNVQEVGEDAGRAMKPTGIAADTAPTTIASQCIPRSHSTTAITAIDTGQRIEMPMVASVTA